MNASDKARLNTVPVQDGSGAGREGDPSRGVGTMVEAAITANNNAFTPSTGTLTVTGDVTATGLVTAADITATDDLTTADLFVTGDVTLGTSKTTAFTTTHTWKDSVGGNTMMVLTDSGTTGTLGVNTLQPAAPTGNLLVGPTGNPLTLSNNGTTTLNGGGTFSHLMGTDVVTVGGVLIADTTAVGNVDTGADTLISYTLPASTLIVTGRGFRITAWGTGVNNADAKTVTLDFGGQTIMTQAMTTSQVNNWRITALVFRTGASTQDIFAEFLQVGTALIHKQTITAGTQTETSTIVIKCTGDGITTNNIVQEGLLVEAL